MVGLEALLIDGQRSGSFRDFDARSMAVLIRGAIEAAVPRLREQPEIDLAAYTREVVTVFELATASPQRGVGKGA